MVMVASDRISAFDIILPQPVPYKGQVLNQIAALNLEATKDIVPNWVIDVPDPNATAGWICAPYTIEMVIRAYLVGHAWREYQSGKREICGVSMPDGMRESDRFPKPIITPATKAAEGHDEDISREEIIRRGLVAEEEYLQLEELTRRLFERGTEMAKERDLILVDTKYEFGKLHNEIVLIDEVHTPDSSRYFYMNSYESLQQTGQAQKQLSKEFVRQWLISEGFQGLDGQQMPEMTGQKVDEISKRYLELFEQLVQRPLLKENSKPLKERIHDNILNWLNIANI